MQACYTLTGACLICSLPVRFDWICLHLGSRADGEGIVAMQDAIAMEDAVSSLEYMEEDRAGGRPKRRR